MPARSCRWSRSGLTRAHPAPDRRVAGQSHQCPTTFVVGSMIARRPGNSSPRRISYAQGSGHGACQIGGLSRLSCMFAAAWTLFLASGASQSMRYQGDQHSRKRTATVKGVHMSLLVGSVECETGLAECISGRRRRGGRHCTSWLEPSPVANRLSSASRGIHGRLLPLVMADADRAELAATPLAGDTCAPPQMSSGPHWGRIFKLVIDGPVVPQGRNASRQIIWLGPALGATACVVSGAVANPQPIARSLL